MSSILLVGVSGFLGAIARYLTYVWCKNHLQFSTPFPYATLAINTLGCFLLGAVVAYVDQEGPFYQQIHLAAAVGFIAAFTTFSTFGLELLNLIRTHNTAMAGLYVALSVIGGTAAAWLGQVLVMKGT